MFSGSTRFGFKPWGEEPSKLVVQLMSRNGLMSGLGKRALDVGCGEGRHISLLRECGYEVVGVDFSCALETAAKMFEGDKYVSLRNADLTTPGALKGLGKFDLVIEWSVLDHVRLEYLKTYTNNILSVMGKNSLLLITEFSTFDNQYKGKNYKIEEGGHYSRFNTVEELCSFFRPLQLVDLIDNEVDGSGFGCKFNSLLLRS